MKFQYAKNVEIVTSLEVGMKVSTDIVKRGIPEIHTIEAITYNPNCESAIMVKISGYKNMIDSNWVTKNKEGQK